MDQASHLRQSAPAARDKPAMCPRLRCIAVGSGKGGVGKTVLSVGLACCLARLRYRVLILDADLGLANVDLQIGIEPQFTLQDVVHGSCTIEDAVVSMPDGPDVLAAASGAPELVDMGGARRQMLADDLVRFAARYDFLIIDVGAGIGAGVTTFLSAAPEVLVVVANEPTAIMDAYALIKVLRQSANPPTLRLVINMVQSLDEGERLALRLNGIIKKFLMIELPVAGIVIYDAVVGDCIRARRPLLYYAGQSAPAKCVEELARFMISDLGRARRGKQAGVELFDKLVEGGLTSERAAAP